MVDRRYEPEDIFDRAEAAERRARIEQAQRDHETLTKYEAEQAAIRKEKARQLSMRANASIMIEEYRRAGVEPLATNGDGVPLVSLALLRWQGWTIEHDGYRNVLVAPSASPQQPRKSRADYDSNS
jgi:hypothetical protein